MRGFGPIRVLVTRPDQGNHASSPSAVSPLVCCGFLRPQRQHFAGRTGPRFWGPVRAVAVGIEYPIEARRARCHTKKEALLRLPPIRQLIAEIMRGLE